MIEGREERRMAQALMRWMFAPVVLAVVLVGAAASELLAARIRIVDLGTLGGASSEATALSNSGHVVGWSTDAAGAVRAFLYRNGAMANLGTLPGGSASYATGINEHGQVVGHGGINEHGPHFSEFTQGFIWDGGNLQPLGALHCPCSFNQRHGTSAAHAINAHGQVVGDSGTVRGESVRHAFVWQNGAMEDIGGGAGSRSISHAFGINGSGQVAGTFEGRAALFQDGTHRDLGTLPGHTGSTARAINAAGVVVGESAVEPASDFRAFLWDGAMRDLGTLPGDTVSQARGVNGAGFVVGWSGTPGGSSRAFLWQRGVMHDLNRFLPAGSGWVLTSAAGINDRGEIAGVGLRNGQSRAFLLTWRPRANPGRLEKLLEPLRRPR
jgi:probable HAF family extracellular repeat protein